MVDDATKLSLYARCLAVYNGVYDEDYGYLTLEAFLASKPVITHHDSGGPLEFVVHRHNGLVTGAEPREIAAALDELHDDRALAERLGGTGRDTLSALRIDWDHVISRLLS